jgi:hypothetical protein
MREGMQIFGNKFFSGSTFATNKNAFTYGGQFPNATHDILEALTFSENMNSASGCFPCFMQSNDVT